MCDASPARSRSANSGHSVATTTASAPSNTSSAEDAISMPRTASGPFGPHGRIVGDHLVPGLDKPPRNVDGRRSTQVVGMGLEAQPEHADPPVGQRQFCENAMREPILLLQVHLRGCTSNVHREPATAPGHVDDEELLRQARTAEPEARPHVGGADAWIQRDPLEHLVHLDPVALAQRRNLVDEAQLEGKEGIRRVLDQLGGSHADHHARGLDAVVDILQQSEMAVARFRIATDDDPRRPAEVLHRRALAQELGVG